MFRTIQPDLLSFDLEWIPDPISAEILHGVAADAAGIDACFEVLWKAGGATPEKPQPFLKTILCRIVSVAGILREMTVGGEVSLRLISLPADPADPAGCQEAQVVGQFLKALGRRKPQLVGFNSAQADVPILVQRAIVLGLSGHGFANRPEKPWDGVDYFSTASEYHIDLAALLGRYNQTPSLHEAASLAGIPGKIQAHGANVPEMWRDGRLAEIVAYNECDAFSTHLLWARVAHFIGLLDHAAYAQEQELVRELLEEEIANGREHLRLFVQEWERLQGLAGKREGVLAL